MTPEILAVDADHCIAQWKNLIVQCWRQTPVSAVDDNIRQVTRVFAAGAKPFAVLVIMDPDSPPPGSAARKRLDALADRMKDHCVCAAYVFEGTGFKAAAMRGVMMALMLVGKKNVPYKICANIGDALAFSERYLTDVQRFGTSSERAAAVSSVRAQFAATAPA